MQYYYERKAKGTSKQIIPKELQKKRGRKPKLLINILEDVKSDA